MAGVIGEQPDHRFQGHTCSLAPASNVNELHLAWRAQAPWATDARQHVRGNRYYFSQTTTEKLMCSGSGRPATVRNAQRCSPVFTQS
jgi:hypothetical protein